MVWTAVIAVNLVLGFGIALMWPTTSDYIKGEILRPHGWDVRPQSAKYLDDHGFHWKFALVMSGALLLSWTLTNTLVAHQTRHRARAWLAALAMLILPGVLMWGVLFNP